MKKTASLEEPAIKQRCHWPGKDPLYCAYHDEEWGVPERDSRALYEKLILDGFQAGLSWITILRKRETFRKAFDGFSPEMIARYDAAKVESLMADQGIIRNRGKIEASILSARAYLEIEGREGFATYIWSFVDGLPRQNYFKTAADIPAQTPLSLALAKDLKHRGFKFCGPTIVYAFCQATGMVNDHLISCFRHKECAQHARLP